MYILDKPDRQHGSSAHSADPLAVLVTGTLVPLGHCYARSAPPPLGISAASLVDARVLIATMAARSSNGAKWRLGSASKCSSAVCQTVVHDCNVPW